MVSILLVISAVFLEKEVPELATNSSLVMAMMHTWEVPELSSGWGGRRPASSVCFSSLVCDEIIWSYI